MIPRRAARNRPICAIALLVLAIIALSVELSATPPASAQSMGGATTEIELVADFGHASEGGVGPIVEFQRRLNAEIANGMRAIGQGGSLSAFLLALAFAFAYGAVHAFGPGHGKLVIVSYFLGREVRVARGVAMAAQIAVVHVIAAVAIVWLADLVFRAGFGVGLSEVPGVRAASFLIIFGIGLYMLWQAVRALKRRAGSGEAGNRPAHEHGHEHEHEHSHGHRHHGGHSHSHGGAVEGGLVALAAGMVPCPGAVLIMLYAVANDMIYPGILLVGAMSLGIGMSICAVGVGAILARQTATRLVNGSGGAGRGDLFRHTMNFAGAILVSLIGFVSFLAFLDAPPG
ncbi:MAG: hypothetical protein OXC10_17540 [Rhodospirillaceae bacterium]|nr:hypothetical protein [Rhodospirillaceae bacterium]